MRPSSFTSLAAVASVLLALAAAVAARPDEGAPTPPDLRTLGETSGYERTGRYEEVLRLASAFERAFPGRARRVDFGVTPEGRTMVALVCGEGPGALDPGAARAAGRPVLLMQGGIHAGEIDGKDAGFLALREMLATATATPLRAITIVFVPVFNADGHERFGANNRPNQIGPKEMGWRTTAQNRNLNRDYAKADAPEMQAMLALLDAWDPLVYADLHVTDGAEFQPDVAVIVDPADAGPEPLHAQARALRDALLERLRALGHLPLPFYPSFEDEDDPASGFSAGVMTPRFSHAYWAARNRVGVLVETHSWKTYAERVRATRDVIAEMAVLLEARGASLTAAARALDEAEARNPPAPVALAWAPTGTPRTIEFPGYAYTREPSEVSGAPLVRYDRSREETWRVPLTESLAPSLAIAAPRGGWLVEAGFAGEVAARLRLHAIDFRTLDRPLARVAVEAFRIDPPRFAREPYEGRTRLSCDGAWAPEARDLAAGALFVPAAQARRRLAMHLLEPRAPDSLASWGLFDLAMQRQEYMEPYVAEAVAREMLARDPALRAEFQARLARDPEFAKSPGARLELFYRRHPSWDERAGLLPVYRVATPP